MKCGEPSDYVVETIINGDYLPVIYLCAQHAKRAEEAIRPERRGCSICHRPIRRAVEVTEVLHGRMKEFYCPECCSAWRTWVKERESDFQRKRRPPVAEARAGEDQA
jgi:hypothetical protein